MCNNMLWPTIHENEQISKGWGSPVNVGEVLSRVELQNKWTLDNQIAAAAGYCLYRVSEILCPDTALVSRIQLSYPPYNDMPGTRDYLYLSSLTSQDWSWSRHDHCPSRPARAQASWSQDGAEKKVLMVVNAQRVCRPGIAKCWEMKLEI